MAYIGKSTPISVEDTVSKSAGGTFGGDVGVTGTLTATSFSGSGLGLSDIIFDTTPQLGGNLDTNSKNIAFGDSSGSTVNRLKFGNDSDLEIYFDGNSKIADVGDGKLELHSNGTGVFIQKGATEYMAKFETDGAVTLYHDNSPKLATSSTGIDVTGSVTANNIAASGAASSLNSGATNVVASFTSSDATAGIQLADNTGNVELSALGSTFQIQPGGGTATLSVSSQLSEPIATVVGGGYGYTHGAIALKSDTGYDARVRGQGIFLFNEENDTTWYAGTPYLNTTAGSRPFDFNFKSSTTSLSAITAYSPTYTAFRVHASGVISTPGGIELGSGVDATAANTLDDYEEGTFTATAGNGVTLYANYDLLHYTKVGRLVTITGQVRVENDNASAGFRISNFPFAHVGNTEGEGHTFGAVRLYNWDIPSGGYYVGCFMAPSSTTCYVEYVQDNSNTVEIPSDSGAYIMFGYTYTAA